MTLSYKSENVIGKIFDGVGRVEYLLLETATSPTTMPCKISMPNMNKTSPNYLDTELGIVFLIETPKMVVFSHYTIVLLDNPIKCAYAEITDNDEPLTTEDWDNMLIQIDKILNSLEEE